MIVLVPVLGPSFSARLAANDTAFVAIGPLAAGSFIRRFFAHIDIEGAGAVNFGAVFGGSRVGNAASFQAGSSVLTVGANTLLGKPVWDWNSTAARVVLVEAALGLRVVGGSVVVIVRMQTGAGGAAFSGGLEVERLVDVGVSAASETLRP